MRIKARTYETLGELMHYLSQYDFKIIYSLGKHNIEAVALSRNPVLESFENEEEVHDFFRFVGSNHILKKIPPFYYFKNMDRIIDKYCKQCETFRN